MKKTTSSEQQIYHEMVATLLPYANKQLELIKDKLTPGTTYTAAEIVKKVGLKKYDTTRTECIKTALGSIGIASYNIFQQVKLCEKYAGLTGKKAHTWTVSDSREVAATATMSFGSKRQMKDFASLLKLRTRYDYEIIVFSLTDGCLRSIVNNYKYSSDNSRLKHQSIGYETPQEFGNLSFKLSSQQLKEMYGECRLSIYKDAEPDLCCYLNPYHVRIVIENADGKCISSNEVIPITEQFIKIYDAEFTSSYEEDFMPPNITKIIDKESTSPANSQSVTSEPSDNDLTICHDLDQPRELQDSPLYIKGLIAYIPPTPEDRLRQIQAERMSNPSYPPDLFRTHKIYIEHSVKKLHKSR